MVREGVAAGAGSDAGREPALVAAHCHVGARAEHERVGAQGALHPGRAGRACAAARGGALPLLVAGPAARDRRVGGMIAS